MAQPTHSTSGRQYPTVKTVTRAGTRAAAKPRSKRGESRDASAADIKQAYRKAALKWHPDKVSGGGADAAAAAEAEARFKQISLAHSVLSDPAQRRLHDAGGKVDGGRATRPAYSTAT